MNDSIRIKNCTELELAETLREIAKLLDVAAVTKSTDFQTSLNIRWLNLNFEAGYCDVMMHYEITDKDGNIISFK